MRIIGDTNTTISYTAVSKAKITIPSESYELTEDGSILLQYLIDDLDSSLKVDLTLNDEMPNKASSNWHCG